MKCFIHLIKTIITSLELQITTNLISCLHALHAMEHTPMERMQQNHGMKYKDDYTWFSKLGICKYYDFATTNIIPNIFTNVKIIYI